MNVNNNENLLINISNLVLFDLLFVYNKTMQLHKIYIQILYGACYVPSLCSTLLIKDYITTLGLKVS